MAPAHHPPPFDAGADPRLAGILARHELIAETLVDRGADFLVLACRTRAGEPRMLKYCWRRTADALRRLRNEAVLTRDLPARPPLRLLRHCGHGDGYLITVREPGAALGPADLGDPALMPMIADALVVFQSLGDRARATGTTSRESTPRFLLKVMARNLLHLWPEHLHTREAVRALAALCGALPAIAAIGVPCHADLLPTNMLRDASGEAVVFVDLEGFIVANHPLYDVLSLLTVEETPLPQWHWQPGFLQRWWTGAAALRLVDPGAPQFQRAYRGLLAFLLVYRYNEARLNEAGSTYFDGGSRLRFAARRLLLALSGVGFMRRGAGRSPALATRHANLRHALDGSAFALHYARMTGDAPALPALPA
ncbi:MAG: phosphotransferase [Gammaproteobacteria bacterium]